MRRLQTMTKCLVALKGNRVAVGSIVATGVVKRNPWCKRQKTN